jgi:hypothetical protein
MINEDLLEITQSSTVEYGCSLDRTTAGISSCLPFRCLLLPVHVTCLSWVLRSRQAGPQRTKKYNGGEYEGTRAKQSEIEGMTLQKTWSTWPRRVSQLGSCTAGAMPQATTI